MEALAKVTPLWHGVDLTRMLTLGEVDWPLAAVHVAYLAVLAARRLVLGGPPAHPKRMVT